MEELLTHLGHILGNEEAAAQICSHIPDLEAGENGDYQRMQDFLLHVRTLIYRSEVAELTGIPPAEDDGLDF